MQLQVLTDTVEYYHLIVDMSPLGNAVAEDCANYCVMMFSDFTRKVTMQNLFHDGGFSSMGMSLRAMNQYAKDMTPYEDENGKVIYG